MTFTSMTNEMKYTKQTNEQKDKPHNKKSLYTPSPIHTPDHKRRPAEAI